MRPHNVSHRFMLRDERNPDQMELARQSWRRRQASQLLDHHHHHHHHRARGCGPVPSTDCAYIVSTCDSWRLWRTICVRQHSESGVERSGNPQSLHLRKLTWS